MINEDVDAPWRQASEEGVSKAALIRRYVGERLRPLPRLADDPLWALVGLVEGNPATRPASTGSSTEPRRSG